MDLIDFFIKIDWEGGVFEALDYGLSEVGITGDPRTVDEVKAIWGRLRQLHSEAAPLVERLYTIEAEVMDEDENLV